jgi:hypothetical protein
MTLINLLVAPIRRVVNFPLFQLMTAIAVILLLQAADSRSVFGEIFSAGEMGREVRLARRRQAPVPASYASGGARRSHLLGRDADYRRPAAGVHAFPRTDLAGQDGKSVGGGG